MNEVMRRFYGIGNEGSIGMDLTIRASVEELSALNDEQRVAFLTGLSSLMNKSGAAGEVLRLTPLAGPNAGPDDTDRQSPRREHRTKVGADGRLDTTDDALTGKEETNGR